MNPRDIVPIDIDGGTFNLRPADPTIGTIDIEGGTIDLRPPRMTTLRVPIQHIRGAKLTTAHFDKDGVLIREDAT